MKNKQPKVRYKISKKISEKEIQERLDKVYEILFEEVLRRQNNQKD